MKVMFGADDVSEATVAVADELRSRGLDIEVVGPPGGGSEEWAEVATTVASAVAQESAALGVVMCWTGTGVTIAANKVAGVRAALCTDAETARGARLWNDANVLAMSIRLSTPAVAREILAAFLDTTEFDESEADNIRRVADLDQVRGAR